MSRIKQLASAIHEKDIVKIESELKHNSFYTESDKNIIQTFMGGLDSREITRYGIESAIELSEKLLEINSNDSYYQNRNQTLIKRLKDFR